MQQKVISKCTMPEFFRIIVIIKVRPNEQYKVDWAFCRMSNVELDFVLLIWPPYIRYLTFDKFIVTNE